MHPTKETVSEHREGTAALRRVLLMDFRVTEGSARPNRYFDVDQVARQAPDLEVCCAGSAGTDEELEQRRTNFDGTSQCQAVFLTAHWQALLKI